MESEILANISQNKASQQMRALLLIFQADAYLTEAVMPYGNCFDGALNMSPQLQVAVLEALCLRWGLRG
jgi:hypothetical protein